MAKKNQLQSKEQKQALKEEVDFSIEKETTINDNIDLSGEDKENIEVENKSSVIVEEKVIETKSEETSEDEQKKRLDEAEQSVAKQNSKKKKIMNLCFFFLNIAIVVGIMFYQLGGEKFEPIEGLRVNGTAIFLMIFVFILNIMLETFSTSYLLKVTTGRWRPGLSYKVTAIGKYYDNVTPLATGGQPFQITYLKSHGESLHTALSVPLAKYLFSQITWVVVSLTCLIISSVDKSYNAFVSYASVIGFVLGSVVLICAIFLSISKSFGKKIIVKVLRLLYKMKIVKNYDKQYAKITKYIEDFQSVMQQYAKSPKDFFVMFFTFFSRSLVYYTIPYLIYCAMNGFDSSLYIQFLVMGVLVDLAASFFPLPGGTGMNEISFSAMFAPFFKTPLMTFWAMLIWRLFSYYYFLLQGIVVISYDVTYGNRKYRWQVKKDNLVEESKLFKQQQIDKFRYERLKRRKLSQKKTK